MQDFVTSPIILFTSKTANRKNSIGTMDTKAEITKDPATQELNDFSKLDNNELFDKLINDINGWGWFQKRMWVLSLIVSITCAFNHLSPLYTAYSPQHRCISSGK